MDIDYIRFQLAGEAGFLIGVFGLILSFLPFIANSDSSAESTKIKNIRKICIIVFSIGCLLLANYFSVTYIDKISYIELPDLCGMDRYHARQTLQELGLQVKEYGVENNTYYYEVERHNPAKASMVLKSSTVEVWLKNTEDTISSGETSTQQEAFENSNQLSIRIADYKIVDSFYYEYPDDNDPNTVYFVKFGKGISGTFEYSRPLNQNELNNWSHGGKLFYSDGVEVAGEGNWPSFWAVSNGLFAVEFPDNLRPGEYIYELYLNVDGQMISDQIEIRVLP